jgi:short-chain fatty acids transporter
MLSRFAARLADWAQRWVPDPFVIALGLTALTFGLGLLSMPQPSARVLASGWFARFAAADTLAFTAQMALILVAGSTLARAPLVRGLLGRLAARPQTTAGAAALTATVAMLAALLNWGFGLVVGAVLAREIGARFHAQGRKLDYPLVAAAGYMGLLVWHGGLSGSAPLKVAEAGPLGAPVPLDQTLFSPINFVMQAALLLTVPWLFTRIASAGHEKLWTVTPLAATGDEDPRETGGARVVSVLLVGLVVVLALLALDGVFEQAGALRGLSIGTVVLVLVVAGLLLFGGPQRYVRAFGASADEAAGILLQFPFYFGILGLLEAGGLVERLAGDTAGLARGLHGLGLPLAFAFDLVTWVSAAAVNVFVPSGGGQWAVQGGIVAHAAQDLGVPTGRAVMDLAYGDQWGNMLQPFWALPLLGITGLRARDIMGYTIAIMLLAAPVFALVFLCL